MLFGQAQHLERLGRRQRRRAGVVQHRVDHIQPGTVQGRQLGQHGDIGAIPQARDADDVHAHGGKGAEHQPVGGIVDKNGLAGTGKLARHQVQRLHHAHRGDDLLGRTGDFQPRQLQLQLLAQRQESLRRAIAQQQTAGLAADVAQGARHQLAIEPLGGQHAGAGRGDDRRLAEHVTDQPNHVHRLRRRVLRASGRRRRVQRRTLAHEKAGAAPRFEVAARHQLVVAGHHRGARHAQAGGALADRGHARAAAQQLVVDARRQRAHDLVDQGFARGARQQG